MHNRVQLTKPAVHQLVNTLTIYEIISQDSNCNYLLLIYINRLLSIYRKKNSNNSQGLPNMNTDIISEIIFIIAQILFLSCQIKKWELETLIKEQNSARRQNQNNKAWKMC